MLSLPKSSQRISGGVGGKAGKQALGPINQATGRVRCPPVSRLAWLGVSCPESHRIVSEDSRQLQQSQNDQNINFLTESPVQCIYHQITLWCILYIYIFMDYQYVLIRVYV